MAAKRSSKRTSTRKPAKRTAKKAAPKKAKAAKARAKPAKASARRAKPARPAKKAAAPAPKRPAAKAKPPSPPKAATAASKSRFVWFDLITGDPAGAQGFYKSLLGWGSKDVDVPPPMNKYTMFNVGGVDFGGVIPPPQPGAPSNWLPYVLVDDADQAARRTEALGGKVLMPPSDIPQVGRFAVIADPTGGVVAPMSFVQPVKPAPERGVVGPVAWCELLTDDTSKAGAFYADLFGWGRDSQDMGPNEKYHLFKSGDRQLGGMATRGPILPATMWITYFMADDVDARHAAAKTAGAKELLPPSDIPNVGRFSWLQDPQGAVFALFKGNM